MQDCTQESMWRSWQGRCCCRRSQSGAGRVYPALSSCHFDWLYSVYWKRVCARTTVRQAGHYDSSGMGHWSVSGHRLSEESTLTKLVQDHSTEDETLLHYCTSHECITRPEHEQSFPKGDTTYLPIGAIDRTSTHEIDDGIGSTYSGRPLDQ